MASCTRLQVVAVDLVVVVAGVAKWPPIGGKSITCKAEALSEETLDRRGLPTAVPGCGSFLGTPGLWFRLCAVGGVAVTRGELSRPISTSSSGFSFPGTSTWDGTEIHSTFAWH